MALPVFTSDDFTVIRTHVRNVKNGYFVNVTFVAVIVIFIFYFFTRVLPTEEITKIRARLKPVIEKYSVNVGPELVNELQSELSKLRK